MLLKRKISNEFEIIYKKTKSINPRGRKDFTQRLHRVGLLSFVFVCFAPSLRTLRLKKSIWQT